MLTNQKKAGVAIFISDLKTGKIIREKKGTLQNEKVAKAQE